MKVEKILITGALGQIGTELCGRLSALYGTNNIVGLGLEEESKAADIALGTYISMDVTDSVALQKVIEEHEITTVYHLASLLSGTSESNPPLAWHINVDPLIFFLERAKEKKIKKLFWPSSIAVFGGGIPKTNVGQEVPLNPTTVYGISKLAGEKWCEYYFNKYQVDVRSIRYPGLISWKAPAGGGTTDYAVDIFYKAIQEQRYTSFIKENTALPMLYMEDAISATLKLMEVSQDQISVRTSYNLGGMSFTPQELAAEIKKEISEFKIDYEPDFRQAIAESWPSSINDSVAKKDWGLQYDFDITAMTKDMLLNLKKKLR
ncbi:NAD-dependent epimerase/dehydratase family protein [Elizabethkingia argentiflava]|uniref:NAD-dependent epimerase/dehydratase family protein n=1 Tax=Elizabethkingia argenteiflava TaxID=2681556 RepID=A0A845PWA5_9FLAO|nr:NAD-dependent epimerase/dehydratase family protein [Elizabethkingia argenteiflava]NAW50598.1 NAD-dependent epimerase/dehydratase family protein [Elizabethkingia argenteiflava]